MGELSQPMQGNMGVFVFSVLDKTESATDYDEKAENVIVTERLRSAIPYLSFEALKKPPTSKISATKCFKDI